jgi:NAD(P)-dependent dehydrogenase (short-subunit alcohol dehydrogenase family)
MPGHEETEGRQDRKYLLRCGRFFSQLSGSDYVSAMAGIQGLTRQLAKELGPFNITMDAVAPGLKLTELVEKKWLTRTEE